MGDGVALDEWNGSRETKRLHETILRANEDSARRERTMLRLTWATLFFAVAAVVVGLLQLLR